MVKAQKSSGRKSAHSVRQEPAEEEGPRRLSNQHSSDRLGASAPSETPPKNPKDTPMDVHASKGDTTAQSKPLWRPIPPLLPEPDKGGAPDTREQSCQTEDLPHQSTAPNHSTGHCVEPGDAPLLQQPLHTSKSGIHQIIECFRSGTSQLRHMLLREVDTIFECKVCRSLFRGLPNLITHKEYYCLTRLPEFDGDDRQSVALKDLTDIIYHRGDRPDYVVRLEPIQTTSKAVYQYVTTEEELARYPSRAPSARESPVAWEQESMEMEAGQPGGPESPGQNHHSQGKKKRDAEEEAAKQEPPQAEDEESTSGVEDVTISCCLCGQDFNSRRSIRRHCRKMHQTKLEELRKFTETRTVPTSLLSMVKGRPRARPRSTTAGKSCHVCHKVFATKTNVRRHYDEVHRGLRRDTVTAATRPGQPLSLEATPPRKSNSASPPRGSSTKSTPGGQNRTKPPSQPPPSIQANQAPSRCTLCKRNYSSQLMLKRHMRIVHKIYSVKSNRSANASSSSSSPAPAAVSANNSSMQASNSLQVKQEVVDASEDEEDMDSSPAASPAQSTASSKCAAVAPAALKVKEEETPWATKPPASSVSAPSAVPKTKLSVGFDFKQLFCKLCKRQFSSRQNLSKHIELHMDGNDIFIKFYRCPLCRYESRRKRDVLRHVTVVHKKSTSYLAKIMPKLESRAVKRLAEAVLNNANPKRVAAAVAKEEVNGRHTSVSSPCLSPPVTRKQDSSANAASSSTAPPPAPVVSRKQQEMSSPAPAPSPPVTRKQDKQQPRPISPPMTRRSDKHSHQRNSAPVLTPQTRRHDTDTSASASSSTEVKVTKNFSLHACDQCGRAFAKKVYLESHKRSHRNAESAAASRRKGVSTRSKSLV
uniref:zinc finger protein 800b n=1 Tax=Doryrhamphus excisus TaxID=161450 RepID=UPI0025AE1C67|nr:zinc finger protein 800b [Doryrhamphus excisus]XP_057934498.1 zinc finger protein 800b [Doryrhamphus excisus]XP_057934499.1 zinc finger protein 800b [Doryrhamphus excisus]XP_057934500.1 zinc finger protein 800b [Doryrhamphus excisus]